MGRGSAIRPPLVDFQGEAKERQAVKLTEIRETLIASGCDTAAKQAAALGLSRATAWALLNRDRRTGPSPRIIKRALSSPNLPPETRRKVEEYVDEKIPRLYGHTKERTRWFGKQFTAPDPVDNLSP